MFLGLMALRQAMRERALLRGRVSGGTQCPGYWPGVSSPGTPAWPAPAIQPAPPRYRRK